MSEKKTTGRPIFSMGSYTIIENFESQDQATNTGDIISPISIAVPSTNIQQNPFKKSQLIQLKKSSYRNPKVFFHYVTPPGDLVEHPQLLAAFKEKLRSQSAGAKPQSTPTTSADQNDSHLKVSSPMQNAISSVRNSLRSSSLNKVEEKGKEEQREKTIISEYKQLEFNKYQKKSSSKQQKPESTTSERISTPNKKKSKLSYYSRNSQKQTQNPQDSISEVYARKLKMN